jgi:GNAT superfamily N-acetyltransferase
MTTVRMVPVSGEASISRISALANEIWREYYVPLIGLAQVNYMLGCFQSFEAVREQISQGYFYYLILGPEGREIGYLALAEKPSETYLSKLYLDAENRGKNYGRQAVDFIKEWARPRGLSKISLSVNKQNPSVKIYQRLGFRIVEATVTDIGNGFFLDDYRMEMEI